ncbi:Regulatory factor, effector binding domain [Plasmopara halstedii]|uniref:Regulatory factor, effector binding domain n=1 Tax=Plasmopara halstedii TaxID=4781 RepID=A0A0P1AP66_PLAHL|nr:Regulatory factor, effector binding domain [Plasmopara halstedii]CEG42820.1 Regulatory factor, effector binding domain [Plasmopara halstedii]|eukprot:XP_024579189.1 Regulatory factor, effector binding domain [Plasmopara halstedii]
MLPTYRDQGDLWARLTDFAKDHNVTVIGPAFAVNYTKDCKQVDVEIEVCLPIAEDTHVPNITPFSVHEIPGVDRAAVMVYVGPCKGYISAYKHFFDWIGSEKLIPAGPSREVYVKRSCDDGEDDKDNVTEIQLPIV